MQQRHSDSVTVDELLQRARYALQHAEVDSVNPSDRAALAELITKVADYQEAVQASSTKLAEVHSFAREYTTELLRRATTAEAASRQRRISQFLAECASAETQEWLAEWLRQLATKHGLDDLPDGRIAISWHTGGRPEIRASLEQIMPAIEGAHVAQKPHRDGSNGGSGGRGSYVLQTPQGEFSGREALKYLADMGDSGASMAYNLITNPPPGAHPRTRSATKEVIASLRRMPRPGVTFVDRATGQVHPELT